MYELTCPPSYLFSLVCVICTVGFSGFDISHTIIIVRAIGQCAA